VDQWAGGLWEGTLQVTMSMCPLVVPAINGARPMWGCECCQSINQLIAYTLKLVGLLIVHALPPALDHAGCVHYCCLCAKTLGWLLAGLPPYMLRKRGCCTCCTCVCFWCTSANVHCTLCDCGSSRTRILSQQVTLCVVIESIDHKLLFRTKRIAA
jgi:hypothetical protein